MVGFNLTTTLPCSPAGACFKACDGEGLPESLQFAADCLEHSRSTAASPAFACSLCPP